MTSLVVLSANGCGKTLPSPEFTKHPDDAYIDVPYPPPAALSEVVPEAPGGTGVVWIDGDWNFRGHSYVWRRGGWFLVRSGTRYAQSLVRFTMDGRLLFAASAWYDEQGRAAAQPNRVVPARTPPNEVTDEFMTGR